MKRHEGAYTIQQKVICYDEDETLGFEKETPRFVQLLHAKRVESGSVSAKDIKPICQQMNKELGARGAELLSDKQVAKMAKVLNTQADLIKWLDNRQEPLLVGEKEDETTLLGIGEILEGGEFDGMVKSATDLEKANCSWQAIIGPAMKALRRLGRTAAGKDFDKLAKYAKEHGKPSS